MTKKQRLIRMVAGIATMGIAVLGLEMIDSSGTSLGATVKSANLTCDGVADDNAGALGSSKKTLAALGSALVIPISVDVQAPAKVTAGSGPFDATFVYTIALPASVVTSAKTLLNLSTINVTSSSYAVDYSGAANGTLSKTISNSVVDLNSPSITQTLSGTITPTSDGQIVYRPGTTTLAMALNVTSPISIGTLQVVCTSVDTIGSTTVQVPGAPNVDPGVIEVAGQGLSLTSVDLGQYITPNDGNPVVPESLAVTKGAGAGIGLLKGNTLLYVGPQPGGTFTAQLKVCGASRATKAVPGVNAITTLDLPPYSVGPLNAHPVAFKLALNGVETAPIPMSYYTLFGQVTQSAWDAANADFIDKFSAVYVEPPAATIEAALAAKLGAGNVKVTKRTAATTTAGASASFDIELTGALGGNPQATVQVSAFSAWLPPSVKTGLLAALSPAPADPNAPPTTTVVPETQETLNNKLFAGTIGLGEWVSGVLALSLKNIDPAAALDAITPLFPEGPSTKAAQAGVTPIPSTQTGLLCTPFTVQYKLTAGASVLAASATAGAAACPTKTVLKRVRVRVRGRTRYVRRRVVIRNCPKAAVTKKKFKKRRFRRRTRRR